MSDHFVLPALKSHQSLDNPKRPIKSAHSFLHPPVDFAKASRVHPYFAKGMHNSQTGSNPHDKSPKPINRMYLRGGVDGIAMGF